jgi:hypothetical protein
VSRFCRLEFSGAPITPSKIRYWLGFLPNRKTFLRSASQRKTRAKGRTHPIRRCVESKSIVMFIFNCVVLGWRSGLGTAVLVGRSRDRSPVVSLGTFSVASDNSMCPGSTQPLKMSTRIFLGVKTAGAYG